MKKRSEKASKTQGQRGRRPAPGSIVSGPDQNETENVQYFLKALNQTSLALQALGYMAEGEMLARVRDDLHNRIFWSPEKQIDVSNVLH